MSRVADVLYFCGISTLLVHEMDAVFYAEWRLLFGLRALPDALAYPTFLVLHLPILFAFFWFGSHANPLWRGRFRFWTALFLPVHACIHAYVSSAPAYTFDSMLSQVLIFGAGGLGVAYLILAYRTGVT